MNVNINNAVNADDFVVDFETEKTAVKLGNSGRVFYMDFGDTNFPMRFKQGREEIAKFMDSKRSELGIKDINDIDAIQQQERTLEDIEKALELSQEMDNFIKNKVNYIFGYDVSDDVFGSASSTSVTRKGDYYFDSFLNAVLPLVEREYGVRIKATSEKIKKYTDKKGTHPAVK